jgi:hypothetical protein
MLSRPGSLTGSGGGTVGEGKYQSLTGVLSPNDDAEEDEEDNPSIFSGVGGGGGKLPPFSPSASSAGWGNMGRPRSLKDSDVGQLNLPPSVEEEEHPDPQNYHDNGEIEEEGSGWGGSER